MALVAPDCPAGQDRPRSCLACGVMGRCPGSRHRGPGTLPQTRAMAWGCPWRGAGGQGGAAFWVLRVQVGRSLLGAARPRRSCLTFRRLLFPNSWCPFCAARWMLQPPRASQLTCSRIWVYSQSFSPFLFPPVSTFCSCHLHAAAPETESGGLVAGRPRRCLSSHAAQSSRLEMGVKSGWRDRGCPSGAPGPGGPAC